MKQYILRFSKPSCNPCAILKQAMATQVLPPEVQLIDVDVSQPMVNLPLETTPHPSSIPRLISRHSIRSVPTLVVVDETGNEVQPRLLGQVTPKEYEGWLLGWRA